MKIRENLNASNAVVRSEALVACLEDFRVFTEQVARSGPQDDETTKLWAALSGRIAQVQGLTYLIEDRVNNSPLVAEAEKIKAEKAAEKAALKGKVVKVKAPVQMF